MSRYSQAESALESGCVCVCVCQGNGKGSTHMAVIQIQTDSGSEGAHAGSLREQGMMYGRSMGEHCEGYMCFKRVIMPMGRTIQWASDW